MLIAGKGFDIIPEKYANKNLYLNTRHYGQICMHHLRMGLRPGRRRSRRRDCSRNTFRRNPRRLDLPGMRRRQGAFREGTLNPVVCNLLCVSALQQVRASLWRHALFIKPYHSSTYSPPSMCRNFRTCLAEDAVPFMSLSNSFFLM